MYLSFSHSKTKFVIKLWKYIMKKEVSRKFEMKKCKNDWVMSSWSLTAMEVTSTVSELGLSQILREKIIVSNTQIFHQIIKIWHEIRHLVKIWDPKIQKWLRYRLLNKKPKFCCTYLSRTLHQKFVIKLSTYGIKLNIWRTFVNCSWVGVVQWGDRWSI